VRDELSQRAPESPLPDESVEVLRDKEGVLSHKSSGDDEEIYEIGIDCKLNANNIVDKEHNKTKLSDYSPMKSIIITREERAYQHQIQSR
jgi:hypothetical protein